MSDTAKVLGVDVEVGDLRAKPFTQPMHGKPYLTVAGRLELLRRVLTAKGENPTSYSIATELVQQGNPSMVVMAARVTLPWGTYVGTSGADLTSKQQVEAGNPFEVAETSAVGRALGFAGLDTLGQLESADGMAKAGYASQGGGFAAQTTAAPAPKRGGFASFSG